MSIRKKTVKSKQNVSSDAINCNTMLSSSPPVSRASRLSNKSNKPPPYEAKINKNTSSPIPTPTPTPTPTTLDKKDKLSIEVKENPNVEDLKEIENEEKFCFKFNNKTKGAYIECNKNADYYIEYYKTFGKPLIYGLYEKNCETKIKKIIGTITLNYRYDNKVCHIMDLKIKKTHRGIGGINKFIMSTLLTRMLKNSGYYAISMNKNTIIEYITSKLMMPKMKDRGKMCIYLVSFTEITKILPTLASFYCSEIAYIDNNNVRQIIDCDTKKPYKILHLHHNAEYCDNIDFNEPQKGYQYCFSIHESNEFIIKELKEKYKIESSSSATVYSNDFKTDWSRFVKTFEI